jgi:hypothetical protein
MVLTNPFDLTDTSSIGSTHLIGLANGLQILMTSEQLTEFPLLFSFREIIMGNGFIAGVRMNGRALLEERAGEIWISGVCPVGLAGGGLDRSVAFTEFRKAWVEILFDIAATATSFGDFQEKSRDFLSAEEASVTTHWEAALKMVRNTNYVDPSLPSEIAEEKQVEFEVLELLPSQDGIEVNVVEDGLRSAA